MRIPGWWASAAGRSRLAAAAAGLLLALRACAPATVPIQAVAPGERITPG